MSGQVGDRYGRLPLELVQTPQWCIAGPDKAPYVASSSGVNHASLHKREHWRDFETIKRDIELTGAPNCGFMLTYDDPWTCIDLDVCNSETQRLKGEPHDPTKWTSAEAIEGFQRIVTAFDSYTEVSTLGWGLHIWVRGRIGAGAKHKGVEVYSQERFIICTGNVYIDKPIAERQELLDALVADMRKSQGYSGPGVLVEVEQEDDDFTIFERAMHAGNHEKFDMLCAGKWKEEYPSQSEADLALMSMFCFYSKSNEQCRRLFRCTELGRREKATKNDRYLNYTLEVIRGRQARESVLNESGRAMAEAYVQSLQNAQSNTDYGDVAAARIAAVQTAPEEVDGSISWPPGVAGALASFIYHSAPRPVKEVAIVAALGFLAGVTGKAFNIPQSGLNAYIILVARSGVGKEAMHSGLSLVLEELRTSIPMAQRFVDFNDFASGPALQKACALNTSFVNVAGEWGRKLKRLADDSRPEGPMATLRTQMTNLYQKSGAGSMTAGIAYSNKEQNIGSVTGVAYSMIGETTPGTFYESLTPSMMEDGFLSRFIVVEYTGERPALNAMAERKMSEPLAQAMQGLCAQALTNINKYHSEIVVPDAEADSLLHTFDAECDCNINASTDESFRQMWNRAHLKVKRIAALLAASDNWIQPIIQRHHVQWALELIRRDIKIMSAKLEAGEIGNDDEARERKMIAVLRKYLTDGTSTSYGVPDTLQKVSIVPKRYLQIRLSRSAQFLNTREGSTRSLDNTIRQMIENGYIQEMDKSHMAEKHNYQGRAFRILTLPNKT
jgi:hypothetical protein